ncbi:hypothetical protein OH76DRAFT_433670 [Lentinus brumalis]|uniref:Uncharacterized protein n=1 Tax=Lentinus brumalis TaxID=2498619 RepID=A0A371DDR8_9APHY|nr:hypothetical protein OH76DRAFT_433670 [Polyporus brumalis]
MATTLILMLDRASVPNAMTRIARILTLRSARGRRTTRLRAREKLPALTPPRSPSAYLSTSPSLVTLIRMSRLPTMHLTATIKCRRRIRSLTCILLHPTLRSPRRPRLRRRRIAPLLPLPATVRQRHRRTLRTGRVRHRLRPLLPTPPTTLHRRLRHMLTARILRCRGPRIVATRRRLVSRRLLVRVCRRFPRATSGAALAAAEEGGRRQRACRVRPGPLSRSRSSVVYDSECRLLGLLLFCVPRPPPPPASVSVVSSVLASRSYSSPLCCSQYRTIVPWKIVVVSIVVQHL